MFLYAPSPLLHAGAQTLLRQNDTIGVLADPSRAQADVLVVVEEAISDRTMAVIRASHSNSPPRLFLRCVIATDGFRSSDLMPALDAGLVAVMSLPDTPARLVTAVLTANDGALDLTPDLQAILLEQLRRLRHHVLEPSGLTLSGLSTRECEVLRLISEGLTTEEIATYLNYSERSIKNVLHAMTTRLGLRNRAHAVAYAVRAGAI